MKVQVNGTEREIEAVATVAGVLGALGVGGRGIAVAVNGAVVRRGELDAAPVREGDEIEIIEAAAGG